MPRTIAKPANNYVHLDSAKNVEQANEKKRSIRNFHLRAQVHQTFVGQIVGTQSPGVIGRAGWWIVQINDQMEYQKKKLTAAAEVALAAKVKESTR